MLFAIGSDEHEENKPVIEGTDHKSSILVENEASRGDIKPLQLGELSVIQESDETMPSIKIISGT